MILSDSCSSIVTFLKFYAFYKAFDYAPLGLNISCVILTDFLRSLETMEVFKT